ncbi:MAG: HAMP domain-containing protein [Chitinivibrionales bacterium]|nr:HAMP domain-containing protein [Chitinivibrionales bacterium]
MLRIRLFKYFGLLVVAFGIISAFIGVQVIRTQIIRRAETQVRSDLNSAWSVLDGEMGNIETIMRMTVTRPQFAEACAQDRWNDPEVRKQLEMIRMHFGLDFVSVLTPEHVVAVRGAPPYSSGDYFLSEPSLERALRGETVTGITLMTARRLDLEHGSLSERAYLVREPTPRARPNGSEVESRGMVMLSAVPVRYRNGVVGVLYGGVLLNRNEQLVTRMQRSVFRNDTYNGVSTGSVTIFLQDLRVATTVTRRNGHWALGTLVSKEVADQVLDNGKPWLGRAFVVRDWYLTAYDPIQNTSGETIGMLYVGILEAPFREAIRTIMVRYAMLSAVGVLGALALAFFLASHVAEPLHALAEAANRMRRGEKPPEVCHGKCSTETQTLIDAFNRMATELTEREEKLRQMNTSLSAINRSYMETLGFISHELKTPLGSILNYAYLLGEDKLGELSERQRKAVRSIDTNTKRITEMVRHYLNLSRIENNELRPVPTRLDVPVDVVAPLLESLDGALTEKEMVVVNDIPRGQLVHADFNMTVEVFENMISNAIKYGNTGGTITLAGVPDGDGRVRFRVRNTGEGIPADQLGVLFEKFSRLNGGSGAKQKRGTGLGLFITRHIIEAHGGTVGVDSEPGAWTEFTFTLPAHREGEHDENRNG